MRYRKTKIKGKTKYVHRVVMEKHLGRTLDPKEKVHHKNEDKLDNVVDNLELTNTREHSRHHMLIHPLVKACVLCGTQFTPLPSHRPRDLTCSMPCKRAMIAIARMRDRAKTVDWIRLHKAALGRAVSDNRIAKVFGVAWCTVGRIRTWPPSLPAQVMAYLHKQ